MSLLINRPNRALRLLRARETVRLYVTGNFATPRHVDFIGQSGQFDAVWFDLEHFDIPTQELAVLNMVARAHGLTTIARFKAADYQSVMRVLETGVGGIMCSMVADAEEARRIVQWAKFRNPSPVEQEAVGERGWNGGNIDAGYGAFPAHDYIRYQNTETMVICQIENHAALSQAASIAAVPGVEGLFFGPGDYAASIGLPGQIAHEQVMAAMRTLNTAAESAGKWWGTVAVGPEMFAAVHGLGARLLCPGGDLKIMNLGLAALVKTFGDTPRASLPSVNGPYA